MRAELLRAWSKHPGQFNNAHEGYAVIREEFEVELFAEHICHDTAYTRAGMKEAVQTAAMAVRFVVELHDHPKAVPGEALDLASEAREALQRMFPPQRLVPRQVAAEAV